MNMTQLLLAYSTIEETHRGQTYGGRPYFLHPIEVAAELPVDEMSDVMFVAALLHDTLEDTDLPRNTIKLVWGEEVLEIVDLLTKDENLTYEENIQRIIDSGNRAAMQVKLADNRVNLRNGPKRKNAEKYERSIAALEAALKGG